MLENEEIQKWFCNEILGKCGKPLKNFENFSTNSWDFKEIHGIVKLKYWGRGLNCEKKWYGTALTLGCEKSYPTLHKI